MTRITTAARKKKKGKGNKQNRRTRWKKRNRKRKRRKRDQVVRGRHMTSIFSLEFEEGKITRREGPEGDQASPLKAEAERKLSSNYVV